MDHGSDAPSVQTSLPSQQRFLQWVRRIRQAIDPSADGSHTRQLLRESLQDHDRAAKAARRALEEMSPTNVVSTDQRCAIEAATDGLRALMQHTEDLLAASRRARDSLERARIVALNAGLDGTRLAAPAGKAVVAIAEDIRTHVSRAAEALDEHLRLFELIGQAQDVLKDKLGQGQRDALSVADALGRSLTSQREAEQALSILGSRLQAAAGVDPEVSRELDELVSHATALIDGLGRLLQMPSRRRIVQGLMAPSLRRLAGILRALEGSPGTGTSPP